MGTITKRSTINKSTVAVKAYDKVRLARNNHRPTGMDYISRIFDDFIELHGDRKFADDPAIVGGLALLFLPVPASVNDALTGVLHV